MSTANDPTRTFIERHLARVSEGMTPGLADAYADDALVEQPFMPHGHRCIEGREALRLHFERAASLPIELRVGNFVVHETTDPEVVIAEYDYEGRDVATGETFTAANAQVFRVRGGEIVSSRGYHDHAVIAAALAAAR